MPTSPRVDRPVRKWVRRGVALLVIAAAATYALSGIYVVQPDERAVVRFGGRIVEPQVGPGVHFAWPAPLGRVDLIDIRSRRLTVGLAPDTRAAIAAGDLVARGNSTLTDVFTGDTNIIKVTLVVGYKITAVDRYVIATGDPDALVSQSVQSVMVETVGGYSVDDALTDGKTQIQEQIRTRAQQLLDRFACGITLTAVNLEGIEPPYAISGAFRDVASAKKNREQAIDEAHSFAGALLPRAQATAFELRSEASSYRERRIQQARGAANRFRAVHAAYLKAPAVTRARLLLDTLTKVFDRATTYVVSPDPTGPPLRITIEQD